MQNRVHVTITMFADLRQSLAKKNNALKNGVHQLAMF
jgi:hypothetical protein